MKPSPTPEQIKERRTNEKLSQRSAAAMIGVSLRTWEAWEGGINPMHPGLWELFTIKLLLR